MILRRFGTWMWKQKGVESRGAEIALLYVSFRAFKDKSALAGRVPTT
jgi:hypothetical protein